MLLAASAVSLLCHVYIALTAKIVAELLLKIEEALVAVLRGSRCNAAPVLLYS
jgi:hypothetical protein